MTSIDKTHPSQGQRTSGLIVATPHSVDQRSRVGRLPGQTTARMLSPIDVAERLQVSIKTVRRWIEADELRVHRFGRQLRISADDLNSFIAQRRK